MKQIHHIPTDVLYKSLNDPAWKITNIDAKNGYRVIATYEPKKRWRLACSKWGTLAIPKCYARRKHDVLHNVLQQEGYRVYASVKQPLMHCRSCGEQGVCPQWLQTRKRHTKPFRANISCSCRDMSCRAVARRFGLSYMAVRKIDAEVLEETAQHTDLSHTKRVLVDEKRIGKTSFATVVLDADSRRVLHIAPGRNSEAFAQFLRHLPPSIKHQIEAVAMDGSRAYRRAVESELPQATICLDRFHLYRDTNQMLRDALQEISQSKEGKMQRQVIHRIAKLTSQDDKQAPALLDERFANHHINAALIAFSSSLRGLAAWPISSGGNPFTRPRSCCYAF